jgi:hypothetical protein
LAGDKNYWKKSSRFCTLTNKSSNKIMVFRRSECPSDIKSC